MFVYIYTVMSLYLVFSNPVVLRYVHLLVGTILIQVNYSVNPFIHAPDFKA